MVMVNNLTQHKQQGISYHITGSSINGVSLQGKLKGVMNLCDNLFIKICSNGVCEPSSTASTMAFAALDSALDAAFCDLSPYFLNC